MKKPVSILLVMVISVVMLLSGCSGEELTGSESGTISITDSLGRTVTIPSDADSFVAIGPGCLRLYCYVGDVSKIVGVEQQELTDGAYGRPYAHANPELLNLPIIGPGGPGNAPDAEKLIEVAPDVILSLYNSDMAAVDELQTKTNIPVVALSYGWTEVFDPQTHNSIEIIGKVIGAEERASEVIAFFDECQKDLAERTAGISEADKPGVYLGAQSMRGTHGIESTSGGYSLFTAVNARNAVDEAGIHEYVMLDKEKLLELDPDIIFLDAAGLANVKDDYSSSPAFYNGLSAFKTGQVYLQLPYNYYYTNIDLALCDAYYIGSIVYPEAFGDIEITAKADEIFTELLGKALYDEMAEECYGGFQKLVFK